MIQSKKIWVPSGTLYGPDDIRLAEMIGLHGSVRYCPEAVSFISGITSHVLVSFREDVTDHPEYLWRLARKCAQVIRRANGQNVRHCLIGIPTTGGPLAAAISLVSYREHHLFGLDLEAITFRAMREAKKQHGAKEHRRWVNEKLPSDRLCWLVDNTITSGKSVMTARERFQEDGYAITDIPLLFVVDRGQGGRQALEQAGFRQIHAVFELRDLLYLFRILKVPTWTEAQLDQVEAEFQDTPQLANPPKRSRRK